MNINLKYRNNSYKSKIKTEIKFDMGKLESKFKNNEDQSNVEEKIM